MTEKRKFIEIVILILFSVIVLSANAEKIYAGTKKLSVFTVNVGNINSECKIFSDKNNKQYNYKLCLVDEEEKVKEEIENHNPDIVFLQEVFPTTICSWSKKWDAKYICNTENINKYGGKSQVEWLLGNNYQVACTSRYHFECIAVKKTIGKIRKCDKSFCESGVLTDSVVGDCDPGFSVSGTGLDLKDGTYIRVVNIHYNSTNIGCRATQIGQSFGYGGKTGPAIIAGDTNLFAASPISGKPFEELAKKNGFVDMGNGSGWTHNAGRPDRILTRGFKKENCEVIKISDGLDHKAVLCSLVMNEKKIMVTKKTIYKAYIKIKNNKDNWGDVFIEYSDGSKKQITKNKKCTIAALSLDKKYVALASGDYLDEYYGQKYTFFWVPDTYLINLNLKKEKLLESCGPGMSVIKSIKFLNDGKKLLVVCSPAHGNWEQVIYDLKTGNILERKEVID